MTKKIAMLILCLLAALSLTACLDVDSMRVRYDLDRNLGGKITIDFKGIRAENEKEMQDFYADYHENAAELIHEWGIEHPEVTLENRTSSGCDGKVTGEMESFLRSLGPMLDDANYEIRKTDSALSVLIQPRRKSSERMVLELRYAGNVIKTNSPVRNETDGSMEWDLQKLDDRGIEFVLELSKE